MPDLTGDLRVGRRERNSEMNSMNYLLEKFYLAAHDLATGEGDARSRVGVAYYRFWTIPIDDFPQELRKSRNEINKLLTRLAGR